MLLSSCRYWQATCLVTCQSHSSCALLTYDKDSRVCNLYSPRNPLASVDDADETAVIILYASGMYGHLIFGRNSSSFLTGNEFG